MQEKCREELLLAFIPVTSTICTDVHVMSRGSEQILADQPWTPDSFDRPAVLAGELVMRHTRALLAGALKIPYNYLRANVSNNKLLEHRNHHIFGNTHSSSGTRM